MKRLPTLTVKRIPSLPKFWDWCLEHLLTNPTRHLKEIMALFRRIGVTKKSKMLDVSVGTGFLAIDLLGLGYDLATADYSPGMLRVFREKLRTRHIRHHPALARWKDLPKIHEPETFDLLFCRGNSIIYAGGRWLASGQINPERARRNYRKTLEIFYALLKPGGHLYIDKFSDREEPGEYPVARMMVGNRTKEIIISIRHVPKEHRRSAQGLTRDMTTGKTTVFLPDANYLLRETELVKLLKRVGFKSVRKLHLTSEEVLMCGWPGSSGTGIQPAFELQYGA